jgi:hypothetical protein
LGSGALAFGVVVYLADRDVSRSALMPLIDPHLGHHIFGSIGSWLPSFVHPFAFSLFTAAALAPRATPHYGACVAWGAINVAFEVGQHPAASASISRVLHGAADHWPEVQFVVRYFALGTFDPGDIAAACLGALAAALVLHLVHRQGDRPHAQ